STIETTGFLVGSFVMPPLGRPNPPFRRPTNVVAPHRNTRYVPGMPSEQCRCRVNLSLHRGANVMTGNQKSRLAYIPLRKLWSKPRVCSGEEIGCSGAGIGTKTCTALPTV